MQTFGRNMEFDWLRENIRIGVVSNRKVYKDFCFFNGNVWGKLMMCWNVRWFYFIDMNG